MSRNLRFAGTLALIAASAALAQSPRSRTAAVEPVTYHGRIERLFQRECQECHRPGEVAPFSLMDYENAWLFSRYIRDAVVRGYMPPWKPVRGEGVPFHHERGLSPNEIALVVRWANDGAPQGDPRLAPPPREFPAAGWRLGPPDLILEMPAPYAPTGTDSDDYRCFSLSPNLTENRKVRAIEIQPGDRRIVHHVILYPDPEARSASLAAPGDPRPGYPCFGGPGFDSPGFYGGWAPGNTPRELPEGVAVTIPANGRIAMQVHYHPDGTQRSDSTRVGLYFSDRPNPRELTFLPLVNQNFVIPAGAKRHEVSASFTVPPFVRARIHAVLPHMHLLGREISLDIDFPDGRTQRVIRIDDWDFDWQDTYWLKEPLLVPSRSVARLRCVYDNSEANPANPNRPPKDVRWGERTVDEMALIFVAVTFE